MTVQRDLIQKRLRDEGDKLLAAFEALTPEQLSQVVYTDGMDWSLKDLLAHLVSAERAFQYYGHDILDGGEGAPEDFDLNRFNQTEVGGAREQTQTQLLAELRAARQESIDLAGQITDADFARQGRHPFFGQMAINDMFKLIYRHSMLHLRDLRRTLGGDADE